MSDDLAVREFVSSLTPAPAGTTNLNMRRGVVAAVNRTTNLYSVTIGGATITDAAGNPSVPSNIVAIVGDTVDVMFDGLTPLIIGIQGLMQWQTVSYLNGWSEYGAGYFPVTCARDTNGFIHLRGMCKGGSLNAYMFTLPVGYRASNHSLFTIVAAGVPAVVTVELSGNVFISTGTGVTNAYVSVDGILFPVA